MNHSLKSPPFMQLAHAGLERCPYIPGEIACMPLFVPRHALTPMQVDELFATGYRRSGLYYYKTHCPACAACTPIRIAVDAFSPSRSQRRTLRRCSDALEIRIQRPQVDPERTALFNRHRSQRNLAQNEFDIDQEDYESFLLGQQCDSLEISLISQNRIVGVSIADIGQDSQSAVYSFFDPDLPKLSLGTFLVLQQHALAVHQNRRWLYLGLFVESNRHLNYKTNFRPHQLFTDGQWRDFAN